MAQAEQGSALLSNDSKMHRRPLPKPSAGFTLAEHGLFYSSFYGLAMPPNTDSEHLKQQVRAFWNEQSCDTQVAQNAKFSREYFEEIEAFRYFDQPFIHSFAQFSRYRGQRVLEVGFGAGTDFIQWSRCGAVVSGIDLTPEALDNLTHRISAYGLPAPERTLVADAENLPFQENSFDLGYSFGVLHHTSNTEKALEELIRVVRPGGEIKVMLYNRHSVHVVNTWVKYGLLKGKPWKSLRWSMWNHMESLGTKGYTRSELRSWLGALPLTAVHVHTELTSADLLSASAFWPLNALYRMFLRFGGMSSGWQPSHYVRRGAQPSAATPLRFSRIEPLFTGNRFGFYHCISARKK